MVPKTLGALLLALSAAASGQNDSPVNHIKASDDSSRENANRIFNTIHSAGRQWGSSYYHNGFSFFPAVIPKGTLLFHGDFNKSVPVGPEWLAFEIEHAEGFAPSHKKNFWKGPGGLPPGKKPPPESGDPQDPNQPPPPPPGQKPISEDQEHRQELRRRQSPGSPRPGQPGDGDDDDDDANVRGYLQTYQATRDLELLYVDGMSAGKTSMGTLDSQDLLLRENTTNYPDLGGFGEYTRALDLCDIVTEWGFDGVVRTEIGFEVIYCDFNDGLEPISMTRTLMPQDKVGNSAMGMFTWARAIGERYDGLGDRLRIDFSSMVSALFFPVNISSPEAARPDLVRLASADLSELKDIKNHLAQVARQPRKFTVNWQSVVDMVVSRFAKRIASMGLDSQPWEYFVDEVQVATGTWFDAAPLPEDITMAEKDDINRTADAIDRCRKHYLRPATIDEEWWSEEDRLVFAAIDTVVGQVCENLFFVRELLFKAAADSSDEEDKKSKVREAVKAGRDTIHRLMFDLGWTAWQQPQPCPPGEVSFIAMWPFGSADDHWHPGCRTVEGIATSFNDSYWRLDFGRRRGRGT